MKRRYDIIDLMTPQIRSHLNAGADMTKKDIMISNFLGGLSWGLGSVLGATLVVGVLIWALHFVNFVPIVGGFTSQVLTNIDQNTKQTIQKTTR